MKKYKVLLTSVLIVLLAVLCSGCSSILNKMENKEIRTYTETMVDAIIAKDFDTAYSLIEDACTKDEFAQVYNDMEVLLYDVKSYELKFAGFYSNTNISGGKSVTTLSTTYEMTDDADKVYVISVESSSEYEKLSHFDIQLYENTKLYVTGTIGGMKNASTLQWIMMLLNIPVLGLVIFAVIDCSRQKIKRKALWLVLIILGLVTFSLTLSTSNIHLNVNLGWLINYCAFIKYGDGSMILRFMLPVGAIMYFIMRNHLIKKASTPPQPPMPPQAPYQQGYIPQVQEPQPYNQSPAEYSQPTYPQPQDSDNP
ncbi:MAG: hypothetical protein IJ275_04420 [Ruminococcus sp.]|nr:hypothetical protein [Ruminococcus sp.]